jgi:DNA-binding response OmpR family regulator
VAKILVAEDNPEMRLLLVLYMQQHGHMVIEAKDGRDLFYWINEEMPDVILLDLSMPNIDGWQALEKLKAAETTKNIPVIIVSAKSKLEDMAQAEALGAHDFVPKPWTATDLAARVNWALATRYSK